MIKMVRHVIPKYPSLISLSREIIVAKLHQATLNRDNARPFFRENQKTGRLELVIPVSCLSSLEKCVLDELNYPKKPVRIGSGFVKAFVINPHHIKDNDLGLAQEIINAYNKLLEESCIGPCHKYRVNQL